MYCRSSVKKVLYNYLANRAEYQELLGEYESLLSHGSVSVQKYEQRLVESESDAVSEYVFTKGELERRLGRLWREVHVVERLKERLIWCYEGERYFCSEALKVLECEYLYGRECRGMTQHRKQELCEWLEGKALVMLNRLQ